MSGVEESLQNKLFNCLIQQINEFELLKSMYPNHNEIVLTDSKVLDDIHIFLDKKSEYTPNHLDFVVNLFINSLKLEVCINLPSFYPSEEPDIFVRCNQLNRQQEKSLNTNLTTYIKNNFLGEVCLYTVISWLQDNIDVFLKEPDGKKEVQNQDEISNAADDKFVRYWIYSHHIYNKRKREEILKQAKDLRITGFCLPGKPGIICIEGTSQDCKQWWRLIKSMTWKKIIIKNIEEFQLSEQKQEQKFATFEEIYFQNPSARQSKHANMSAFSKFMEEHGLNKIFNDFFGIYNEN